MDVTGWTIDQKMRLPDWCFGNREAIGCQVQCPVAGVNGWGISEIALPDPACIWSITFWLRATAYAESRLRFGLRAEEPLNPAQMDTAIEILPYVGEPHAGPNFWRMGSFYSEMFSMKVRKGMVTNGLKLVMECQSNLAGVSFDIILMVSALPTSMAGWLEHSLV